MKMRGVLGTVVVGLMLAGCGGGADREAALQGQWKLRPEAMMAQNPGMAQGKSAAEAKEIGKMLGSFTLDMKSDKTFAMKMMNLPMEGTYTFDKSSGKGTMTMTKMNNQPIPAQAAGQSTMTCQLDADNKRLTISNPNAGAGQNSMKDLVFTKPE